MDIQSILGLSLKTILLGLGTVFTALIGLIFVIQLINWILNRNNKESNVKEADSMASQPQIEEMPMEEAAASEEDPDELIAVITAAIAASLNRSTHDIVVRSVHRIPSHRPVWNLASRREQISSKL